MAMPLPVATGTWNVVPGEGGKLAGSEFLHGAVHHVSYVYPAAPATAADYKLDGQWTNSIGAAAVFKTVGMTAFRTNISTVVVPALTKDACSLDPVIALVVDLPPGWEWCPGTGVQQVFTVRPNLGPLAEVCHLAHHLLAMRSTIEARRRQMAKLNVPEVSVTTDAGREKTEKTTSYRLNWTDVLAGGRGAVVKALQAGPPTQMISGPPSKNPQNQEMNRVVAAEMFKADAGLTQLERLGLIDLDGKSGKTFMPSKGKLVVLSPDRSADLHAAYNHIRFLLYMEWRGVHELLI
ncbi:hypothetical protein [Yinghuangia sp. YIM S09857]|uniref:hypothetical protein n=1 Tax=Yinghuangia sp. YIM S09857 TaxID=3436929 RepID=UPI003F532E5D